MGEKTAIDALLKAKSMGHAQAPRADALPPPPYQLRGCSFLMVGAEFDRNVASRLVPPELEVVDEVTGGFYVYTAPLGWGIAPYTATLAWIDIKGHDSADGSRGRYMVFGAYSGKAAQAMRYNASITDGRADIDDTSDLLEGSGGPSGETYLRIGARKTADGPIAADGTHYYLAPMRNGGICSIPVAFSYDFNAAQPEYVDLLAPPETALGQMRPKQLTWAGWLTNGVITIGQHIPVFDRQGAATTMSDARYLNFLTQIDKAAIAIRPDDTVMHQNAAAERLAGDGFWLENGRFGVAERILPAWSAAKAEAFGGKGNWWDRTPVGLPRRGSLTPLIAQLVPSQDALGATGTASVLLLITDPARPEERDATPALRLLGLTPAEARLAALVGTGQPPRTAAVSLGITEGTARTTLKAVFSKLGLSRQAELARLVSRLQS